MIRGASPRASPAPVANGAFLTAVSEFQKAHVQASQSISIVVSVASQLLNIDHEPKINHCKKLKGYCDDVSGEITINGSSLSPEKFARMLAQKHSHLRDACFALAGPHVSIISALKNSANSTLKGSKLSTTQTNRLLSNALQGVNAINAAWKFVQHYPLLLFAVIKAVGIDNMVGKQLKSLQTAFFEVLQQAQTFSEGARMKVAEETFEMKMKIPKSKKFRHLSKENIMGAGPCIRSEVVFRHKGKAISKIPKAQPMRLSIFGQIAVLTASALDSETVILPPAVIASCEVILDTDLPKDVFHLRIRTTDLYLRSKTPGQTEAWIQFFNSCGAEAERLLKLHQDFRDNLKIAEHIRSSSPVPLQHDADDTNLSLLTHRAHHPATRKPAPAWGGTEIEVAIDDVDLFFAQDNSHYVDFEATMDKEHAEEEEEEDQYITIEDGEDDVEHADEYEIPKITDVAEDPWTPRAASPANVNNVAGPQSFSGLLPPPPSNQRTVLNPRPEAKTFEADFDSAEARKALDGRAVRLIPVQPLKSVESTFDVFNPVETA